VLLKNYYLFLVAVSKSCPRVKQINYYYRRKFLRVKNFLNFLKEYKKAFLIPLILMVVITFIIFILSSLGTESNFKYLG